MNSEELHISSLIVHIRPEKLQEIEISINLLDGAELITMSPIGKAVVVLEAPNQGVIMEVIDTINALDGVINTGLVYHEFEKLES
ncbi:MAG: nitrate reductase NapD [Psychromonas sp.]|jgi:nitrate reductase NapD|uniref:chaperone NapD n=1 Tax=Psychromonas sp. TaxID=1884585 RepID=UPI0039E67010